MTNKVYIKHVKIARIALKNDRGAGESLQITGRRKESLSGWLKQAKAFYVNGINTPKVVKAMSKYGITKKKMSEGKAMVEDVELKYNAKLKETGEAQDATQQRDEAFDIMQDWMSDFIGIARIALEEQPQYLEMLGIVEPS